MASTFKKTDCHNYESDKDLEKKKKKEREKERKRENDKYECWMVLVEAGKLITVTVANPINLRSNFGGKHLKGKIPRNDSNQYPPPTFFIFEIYIFSPKRPLTNQRPPNKVIKFAFVFFFT